MTIHSAFRPHFGSNQVVTPAAASASITIGASDKSLLLQNTGANICYVRIGLAANGTVTATTADLPIPAGAQRVIAKPQDFDTLAHISAAGTALQVMSGEGGI